MASLRPRRALMSRTLVRSPSGEPSTTTTRWPLAAIAAATFIATTALSPSRSDVTRVERVGRNRLCDGNGLHARLSLVEGDRGQDARRDETSEVRSVADAVRGVLDDD